MSDPMGRTLIFSLYISGGATTGTNSGAVSVLPLVLLA